MSEKTADQKSEMARQTSKLANLWLEHPSKAHRDHESAAAAHDNEAFGPERERHLRLAIEHRKAAQYWAYKESNVATHWELGLRSRHGPIRLPIIQQLTQLSSLYFKQSAESGGLRQSRPVEPK